MLSGLRHSGQAAGAFLQTMRPPPDAVQRRTHRAGASLRDSRVRWQTRPPTTLFAVPSQRQNSCQPWPTGRYQEAFEYCQEGLAIALKTSNKLEYGYTYMVLAELCATEAYRDWDKAAWYLDESLKAFREADAKVDVGRAHLAGARIALRRGNGTARRWAETARQIFAEHGAKALLEDAEELLVTLERAARRGIYGH